jgi:hypothetical protein
MKKSAKLPKAALEFFREQGRAGVHKRAERLSPEQRSEIARKAVQARWTKRNEKQGTKRQPKSTTGGKQK